MASKFGDDAGGNTHVSGSADIVLDAEGGDLYFSDGGVKLLQIHNNSSDVYIQPVVSGKDLQFATAAGDVAVTLDSVADSFGIWRKLQLGGDMITSDGTLTATNVINAVVSSTAAGTVTGTLADATIGAQVKIIVGLSADGGGTPRVAYTNIGGSTTTKTLTVGTGIILISLDLGGGAVRWVLLGDVS